MTFLTKKIPTHGRLIKLFTDLGPYFRKLKSTESVFFFDCLEVCVDPEIAPEQREFYGWWLVVSKEENAFYYQRFDGLYNLAGTWVAESLCKKDIVQIDNSFALFIQRLQALIEIETGIKLEPQKQAELTEV
jgi:sigma factor-binding protein Crl